MVKIEDLKNDLYLGDCGEQITEYNNGYISDIINEISDNNIDIYNYNLFNWVAENLNNIYYCDQAIQELGATDIIGILQGAQMLYYNENLFDNIEDILKYYIYNYIQETLGLEEISEEKSEEINFINLNNFDKLEQLNEEIENIFNEE